MAFHRLQRALAAGVPGYSGIIPPASASTRAGGGAGRVRCSRWAARGPSGRGPGPPGRRCCRRSLPPSAGRSGSPAFCAVDHGGHALHRLDHLLLGRDAVAQPVGDVLAGDAERRAVFHQADIVDVRHLGATDAVVDPADDVAQDALRVVVQLLLNRIRRPVRPVGQRDRQDVVQLGALPALQFFLRGPPRRPCGSAGRGASRPWAMGPRRCWRRPADGRSWSPASRPCGRASPTCPCRSGRGP